MTTFMVCDILISYDIDVHKLFFFLFFAQPLKSVQNILSSWTIQKQAVGQIWSSGSSLLTDVTDQGSFHSLGLKVHGSQQAVEVTSGIAVY